MATSPPSAEPVPRISVLLPVYNAERFLAAALDSVLAQDFTDFELLAHDDGSTDGSWAILQDYAARDPRIRLSQAPNAGLPTVLNRLVAAARAPLLARMDADDLCLPWRFSRQLAYFEADPTLDVLGSFYLLMDAEERPIFVVTMPTDHAAIDDGNLRGMVSINHPTVMMRREAVLAAGGYDPAFAHAEDLDLWLRIGERGRFANMPDAALKYRLHGGSVSGSKRAEQEATCRRACEAAKARRGVSAPFDYGSWRIGEDRASKIAFYSRYAWQAWQSGYRGTWRHYALEVLKLAPFSLDSWKLLILGALRRPVKVPEGAVLAGSDHG